MPINPTAFYFCQEKHRGTIRLQRLLVIEREGWGEYLHRFRDYVLFLTLRYL